MTESERPDQSASPEPADPAGASAPAPSPAPYRQPPLPGEAAGASAAAGPADPYRAPQPEDAQPWPSQAQQPWPQQPPAPQESWQRPFAPPSPYAVGQQPPYPGQAPYPAAPAKPPKKKWPWVLAGCLIVFLLGIGGCVSCTAVTLLVDVAHDRYGDDGYRSYDEYRNPYDGGFDESDAGSLGLFPLSDIEEALGTDGGTVEDGRCTPGVFEVGAGKDLEPGLYFFEGSQTAESNFYVFESEGADAYRLDQAVVYFGNYFAELEAGDAIAFEADADLRFYPVSKADFKPEGDPYPSGLYRVGADIPAGTYTVTVNDDSVTETKYVLRGGSQTITVKDGDYLELYATTAAPATARNAS